MSHYPSPENHLGLYLVFGLLCLSVFGFVFESRRLWKADCAVISSMFRLCPWGKGAMQSMTSNPTKDPCLVRVLTYMGTTTYGRLVPTVDPRAPIASEAVANPATGTAQVWLQNR